jgi:hypothetical protein
VAIVQISRITQRKGLTEDLPQPLAGAELGWATDTRQLFIGNGTIEDGAPVIGNTEVLTEFSDILAFSTAYTYEGAAAGYTVQTGPGTSSPESQSIQARLDSYAIVTDFGAVGDGVTDDTAAINRALYQLYCREANTAIRRSLFFPAGTYVVTDTIAIPPYALLYGEGSNSSIVKFTVNAWTNAISYSAGVLVSNSGSFYRANFDVPIGTALGSTTGSGQYYWGDISTGAATTLPACVASTADSLQQTGVNIGSNGATPPQYITIQDMSFATDQLNDPFLWQNAQQCSARGVTFAGGLTTAELGDAVDDTRAVDFAGTSPACENIIMDTCKFTGCTYATSTSATLQGITYSNSNFDTLYQGLYFSTNATGVRIVQNTFDNIYVEGIVFSACSLNASAYNTFYDVGNQFSGIGSPASNIILISGDNNISVGDMFTRTTANSTTYARIALSNTNSTAMSMNNRGITYYVANSASNSIANQLAQGTWARDNGINDSLANNSSGTLFIVTTSIMKAFKMDYTITRDIFARTGQLTVVYGLGGGFGYTDEYIENGIGGITLVAAEASAGGNITVSYTSTNSGYVGNIKYSVTHLN